MWHWKTRAPERAEHLSQQWCFHSRPLSRQTNKLGYCNAKTCRGSLVGKIQWEKCKILARECKRLLRAAWGQCASLGWGQELCHGVGWEQHTAPTSPLARRFHVTVNNADFKSAARASGSLRNNPISFIAWGYSYLRNELVVDHNTGQNCSTKCVLVQSYLWSGHKSSLDRNGHRAPTFCVEKCLQLLFCTIFILGLVWLSCAMAHRALPQCQGPEEVGHS